MTPTKILGGFDKQRQPSLMIVATVGVKTIAQQKTQPQASMVYSIGLQCGGLVSLVDSFACPFYLNTSFKTRA